MCLHDKFQVYFCSKSIFLRCMHEALYVHMYYCFISSECTCFMYFKLSLFSTWNHQITGILPLRGLFMTSCRDMIITSLIVCSVAQPDINYEDVVMGHEVLWPFFPHIIIKQYNFLFTQKKR